MGFTCIGSGGARSSIYRFNLAGKPRYLGLGSANAVPLKRAREPSGGRSRKFARRRCRSDRASPQPERMTARVEIRQGGDVAASAPLLYVTAHEAGWRNREARGAVGPSDPQDVRLPVHRRAAGAGGRHRARHEGDEPIWATKPETATRVRGRIETILDWAKGPRIRQGENPARWRGHLENLLPTVEGARRRAPRRAAVRRPPGVHGAAERQDGLPPACARIHDPDRGAHAESDRRDVGRNRSTERIWTISAAVRMKAGREHRVPLSAARSRDRSRAFRTARGRVRIPGCKAGAALATWPCSKCAAHGPRRSDRARLPSAFRDWVAERTSFPHEVARWRSRTPSATRSRPPTGAAIYSRSGQLMKTGPRSAPPTAAGEVVQLHATKWGAGVMSRRRKPPDPTASAAVSDLFGVPPTASARSRTLGV